MRLVAIWSPAQLCPVAYRQTPWLCFVEPWLHGSALILHLLVLPLPLSLSAHTTYLSLNPLPTAFFSGSLPAATQSLYVPAGHPLSGRHLNLAPPYISCDARILGQTDFSIILEVLSCREFAHVLFVSPNLPFKYSPLPSSIVLLTLDYHPLLTTLANNNNVPVRWDVCHGKRQNAFSNTANGCTR